ncbi:MAG: HlyC/CorC family transporter [Actinobacteria bacterium]|nr:MAG: HlyC/CorC family transporter [Actinomycetota bacterium]
MDLWLRIGLVLVLVAVNAVLAGSEIALIALREPQIRRLETRGRTGRVLSRLARDPRSFFATIQIGITLAGFMASAAAAVTLAEPLVPYLDVFGTWAEPVAVIVVTLVLAFVTLVFGEIAPKRIALQRSEQWSTTIALPLHYLAVFFRPIVWLLSASSDFIVRLAGGEPGTARETIDLEELKDHILFEHRLGASHQEVLVGALEVAERTLREVGIPRPDVFVLDADELCPAALQDLVASGHSRAPAAPDRALDQAVGIVHMRDLVLSDGSRRVAQIARDAAMFPETLPVLEALRRLQASRQQMALVVDEHGGIDGIVTIEDLVEEVVGEIYDETDRDVVSVKRETNGSIVVPGRFPVHDLVDLGVEAPEGDYTTVAGLVVDLLGSIPTGPGETVHIPGWQLTVLAVGRRAIRSVRLTPETGSDQSS